ncbi:MAG: carboxypeptidase-like regulatory domain-containing protein [Acidobacteriaceae bacterium]
MFAALLLATLPGVARAQASQASIRGTVYDSSRAVVPGAALTLTNVATHVNSTTTSNESGGYLFLNINPGTYTLQASKQGFATQQLQPFKLLVNQASTLNFALTVGQVSQVARVTAVGEGLQSSTAEVGLTLDTEQIQNVPVDSESWSQLFVAAPGVSPIVVSGSQTGYYTTSVGPMMTPSFDGQTNRSDIFIVDGIMDTETFGNSYAVQPLLQALQDVKLEAHTDSAAFGGSSGGTINASTRSGTDQFHGSAWEYYKSPVLQAIPYFSTSSTPFKQNQFGGTIGGPVILPRLYNGRNKTFFFAAYGGLRYNGPGTVYDLVPTPAELAGDFTADAPIYDPASTTCDAAGNCTRTQFQYNGVLNMIPPNRLNQGAIYYVQHALPTYTNATLPCSPGCNSYQNAPNIQSLYQYDARVDETLGQHDSFFFRWMGIGGNETSGRVQNPGTTGTTGYSYVGSYVHIFSPTSVLHVQAGKTYETRPYTQLWTGVGANLGAQSGFPSGLSTGYVTLGNITPGFDVNGYFNDPGDNANPQTTANSDSVSFDYDRVLGRHTITVGADFNGIGEGQRIEDGQEEFAQQETNSLVPGDDASGTALASFLIGVPDSFTKRNVTESLGFGGLVGFYGQDQFQMTPRLTTNFGLRYDIALAPRFGTFADGNEYTGNFNFSNGTYIVYKVPGSCAVLMNAPCIPTPDGSLPDHVVASTDGSQVVQTQYNNVEPRLGIAFRLTPTTVLRGGAGLAFDNLAGLVQNIRGLSGNWPSVQQVAQLNINVPQPGNPFPGYTISNLPALTALPAATPFNQFNWFVAPNLKDAYSLQYNFGVQHQFGTSTVVGANYVGSVNRRSSVGGLYNVALTPGPGDSAVVASRSPYPYIAPTYYSWSGNNGDYNALQVQLTRNYSKNLGATVAYTWSKSIDEGCSGFFGTEGCSIQQIYNIRAERSVSAFNVPQNLNVTWTYTLPFGRGQMFNIQNRTLDLLLGGWHYNGFAKFANGAPYDVNLYIDIANIGTTGYERPNIVGSTNPGNQSRTNWLNTAAFATPNPYTYGNMGRNSLRADFTQDFDMTLAKEVPLIDRLHLKVGADAFNVFNHPVWAQPDSYIGDPTFGQVLSTENEQRTMQVYGQLTF